MPKYMSSKEREALIRLKIVENILENDVGALMPRAKELPRVVADIKTIVTLSRKVRDKVRGDLTEKERACLDRNIRDASYVIGVVRADRQREDKTYGTWISWETLNELLLACHDHCLMCGKSVQEQRSCTLRKAIDEGLNNDIEDKGDRCRYFGNL